MIYHRIAVNVPLSDGLLTYSHSDPLPQGARVLVPFRNKTVVGIVWETDIAPDMDAARILSVQTAFSDEPPLPESWRDLLSFTSRYYHYPTGQAVFAALPQGLKETRAVEMPQPPLFYTLNEAGRAQTPPPARFNKKAALWDALLSCGMTMAALKQVNAQAAKLIEDWVEQGWIETTEAAKPVLRSSEFQLNANQQQASDEIQTAFGSFQPFLLYGITGSGKTEVYLHWMEHLLASQPDVQVLLMVPEIGLTPALQMQLQRRFPGQPIAVLHSEMTDAARASHWLAAASGRARIILGTRLAVLAPLPRLGAIIVDEEHDPSYKQQEGLRYSARDMAVARGRLARIPVLLGSATPSLESWHNAQLGRYRLLRLRHRARSQAALPKVKTVALRGAKTQEGLAEESLQAIRETLARGEQALLFLNRRGFAPVLGCDACGWLSRCNRCDAYRVLHRISPGAGERRTKASAARTGSRAPSGTPGSPPGTGDDPSLGLLPLDEARESGDQRPPRYRLVCHHCATTQTVPRACPACGNQDLAPLGRGTQKLEDALATLFPSAHIGRLDRDVARRKGATQAFLDDVHAGRTNLLVGTQMLAKGHDFDRLTLVVVVDADAGLFTTDFRAPERLFATLMQVAGRAGRHRSEHARTLIQTRHPEHPLFESLRRHDYPSFAAAQLADRQAGALPPFGFQALLQAQARDLDSALAFLQDARQYLLQAIQTAHAQQQRPGTSGHGSGPSEAFSTHPGSAQTITGITNYNTNTPPAKPSTSDVITHNAVQASQKASQAASVRVPHEAQETGFTTYTRIIDNNENSTRYRGPSIHPDALVEICDPVPMPLAQVNKVFRAQLLIESSHRPSLHALLASWQASVGAGDHASGVAGSAGHHHKGVRWQLIIDPQEI